MKKVLSLLLCIVAIAANSATPPEVISGGIKYAIDPITKTATVAQAFRDRTQLTILHSVEYEGVTYPVKSIPNEKLASFNVLEEITIEADLDLIGISAFEGCVNLKKVTISGKVDSLKNSCFRNCPRLSEVNISGSVNVIGDKAFEMYGYSASVDGMTITFPSTLKSIGEKAFYQSVITEAVIPESVEEIGEKAFGDCEKLSKLVVNCSMPVLSGSVFSGCSNLTSAEFTSEIVELGGAVFSDCTVLTQLKFPKNIQKIGNYTFYRCVKLNVRLPETITSVGDYALAYTPMGIESLPENITEISRGLFRGCSFTSVVVPERIKMISPQAFLDCAELERIEIAGEIPCVSAATFSGCKSLTSVKIRGIGGDIEGNTETRPTQINASAFNGCVSLRSIIVPDGITAIGSNAFNGCEVLTEINFPSTLETLATNAFAGCSSLTTISFPPSLTTIQSSAFPNLASLETVNCYSSTPPDVDLNAFEGTYPEYMTLHVLQGYKDVYAATHWKMFGKIIDDLDPNGYVNNESIAVDDYSKGEIDYTQPYDVFNTTGVHLGNAIQTLSPGIYVIQQNRNAEKRIIR